MPLGKIGYILECKEFTNVHPGKNGIAGKNRMNDKYITQNKIGQNFSDLRAAGAKQNRKL